MDLAGEKVVERWLKGGGKVVARWVSRLPLVSADLPHAKVVQTSFDNTTSVRVATTVRATSDRHKCKVRLTRQAMKC